VQSFVAKFKDEFVARGQAHEEKRAIGVQAAVTTPETEAARDLDR